jgi:hypothetical protein
MDSWAIAAGRQSQREDHHRQVERSFHGSPPLMFSVAPVRCSMTLLTRRNL